MDSFRSRSDVLRNLMFGTIAKPLKLDGEKTISSGSAGTKNTNTTKSTTANGAKQEPVLQGAVKQTAVAPQSTRSEARKRKKKLSNAKRQEEAGKTREPAPISHEEAIKRLRREHHIHVYGSDLLDPVTNFQVLFNTYGIDKSILSTISQVFRYEAPTAVQMQVIPFLCERRQVLVCAPTGSGKTAAFLVPVLHHCASLTSNVSTGCESSEQRGVTLTPKALILAPTADLAAQIYRVARLLTEKLPQVQCTLLEPGAQSTSGLSCQVLISTPNRLVYALASKDSRIGKKQGVAVDLSAVQWLVVDECDKLFEDGVRGFRDQLAQLFQACTSAAVRYAFFSATYAHELETWCKSQLDNLVCVYVGSINAAVSNVKQEMKFVGDEYGKLLALRELLTREFEPPALVFVQSRQRAAELLRALLSNGEQALRGHVDVLHAAMATDERNSALQRLRTGVTWLLVCTDVAARGLDVRNVRLVVNYDMPTCEIVYIHRIGRTGRAGQTGHAVTLFTEDDRPLLNHVARVMKRAGFEVPTFALQLSKLRGKRKKDVSRRPPEREAVGRPRSERTIRAKQRKDKMVHRQARMDKQAEEQASRKRKRKPQALSSD